MTSPPPAQAVDECPYCGGVAPLRVELVDDEEAYPFPMASSSCGACGVEVAIMPASWLPAGVEWQGGTDEDAD